MNALKTKKYDPDLFNIIKEVFPCQNKIIHRCDQTVIPDDTVIEMNCENRPFSPTQEDLFLATYAQKDDSPIEESDGELLVWNVEVKSKAEATFICDSAMRRVLALIGAT